MAIFYGCHIPEELYYHPEYDSWIRFEEADRAVLGMTDIAQTAAGKLLYVRFKKIGKTVKAGRSGATIESAKWVGPFRMPFDAEILATNEETFARDILIANRDPYGEGWLVKVQVLQPQIARDRLITGDEAVVHFQERIEANDIRCFRCVDGAMQLVDD